MARNDYSRFFALLKGRPEADKEQLVEQFTGGRTTSLRQMSRDEYNRMCDCLQYGTQAEREAAERRLRSARSSVLLRLGRLGINTIDNWSGIDAFCMNPRIAGKRFAQLTEDELHGLTRKLGAIMGKGGLKALEEGGDACPEDRAGKGCGAVVETGIPIYINRRQISS